MLSSSSPHPWEATCPTLGVPRPQEVAEGHWQQLIQRLIAGDVEQRACRGGILRLLLDGQPSIPSHGRAEDLAAQLGMGCLRSCLMSDFRPRQNAAKLQAALWGRRDPQHVPVQNCS
jgi:hypothetical protein